MGNYTSYIYATNSEILASGCISCTHSPQSEHLQDHVAHLQLAKQIRVVYNIIFSTEFVLFLQKYPLFLCEHITCGVCGLNSNLSITDQGRTELSSKLLVLPSFSSQCNSGGTIEVITLFQHSNHWGNANLLLLSWHIHFNCECCVLGHLLLTSSLPNCC